MIGMVAQNEQGGLPAIGEGEGRMPGGEVMFAGDDEPAHEHEAQEEEGEEGDREDVPDDEDEDSDEVFLPVRIVQNLLGRLWGGRAEVDSNSDSDHEAGRREPGADGGEGSRADDVD